MLIAQGPVMFLGLGEEREARVEVLQNALKATMMTGTNPEAVRLLNRLLLETLVDAFR